MQRLALLVLKLTIQFVCWVFILSIEWQGATLFSRAKGLLVDNIYVSQIKAQAKEASSSAGARVAGLIEDSKSSLEDRTKVR
jgi:hypothetical protein